MRQSAVAKISPDPTPQPHDSWVEDAEFDKATRNAFVDSNLQNPGPYSDEVNRMIQLGLDMFSMADGGKFNMKKFDMKSSLLKASVFHKEEEPDSYGRVCGKVHSSISSVLAFNMDYTSKFQSTHNQSSTTIDPSLLEVVNPHHSVFYIEVKSPPPFKNRDFVWSAVWKKVSSKQCILVLLPSSHKDKPVRDDVVRAESTRIFRFSEVSPLITEYDLVQHFHLKGKVPRFITENYTLPVALRAPSTIQKYFLQIKRFEEYDKKGENGRILGILLVESLAKKRGREREVELLTFFSRTAALRDLAIKLPWLKIMIFHISLNKLRSVNRCGTILSQFSSVDAENVGKSFASVLATNATHDAAVDEFLLFYPALKQLDVEVDLLRPFLEGIAMCLLENGDFGMKLRVSTGAAFSVANMATDVVMILQFIKSNRSNAAVGTIIMIFVNNFLQILLIYGQNSKKITQLLRKRLYTSLPVYNLE